MADEDTANRPAEVLRYQPVSTSPRRLCLCEEDRAVVIQFPATPKWVSVASVALQIVVGLVKAGTSAAIALALYRVSTAGPPPPPQLVAEFRRVELSILAIGLFSGLFWWSAAFYSWWIYRHGAGKPKTLMAYSDSLVLNEFRWVRRRETVWPVSNIAGIELHPIKGNLNWTRTVADLYVRLHKGGRKRFRLSSCDPLLPDLLAQRLSTILAMPLSQRSWRRIVW